MPQNIEIKARLHDRSSAELRIRQMNASGPETLVQTDTFFECRQGRMKLRECPGVSAELIVYLRSDSKEPKHSDYVRLPVADAGHARALLEASHGLLGVVKKTRRVYLLEGVRIHLDDVDGLGTFLELEVLLEGRDEQTGMGIAERLMAQLGVQEKDLVAGAYIDLLSTNSRRRVKKRLSHG